MRVALVAGTPVTLTSGFTRMRAVVAVVIITGFVVTTSGSDAVGFL
jgi:hypothetical protein